MTTRPHRAAATLAILLSTLATALLPLAAPAQEAEPERFAPASRGPRAAVLERDEVVDIAAEVFGFEVAPYVAAIARCESGYARFARSAGWDRVFGWYDHRGLMQIASTIWTPLALELTGSDDLYDPWVNLVTARAIQRQQGWIAWPYCSRVARW